MGFTKIMTALVACSMAATPALATASASKLSIAGAAGQRASSEAGEANEAVGGILIPAIALIAIIGGVLIISDGDDSDSN